MRFHIVTIFPEIFDSYFNMSIIKRAQDEKKIKIRIYNLRDWTEDKHKTVDDTPYGGGAGMVMKVDVLYRALQALRRQTTNPSSPSLRGAGNRRQKIILTSAKGKTWNQAMAKEYSNLDDIIIICGRYEGVDERITNFIDEEISIGDYVLTGGEVPAMAIVDSTARLLPGVLGNEESSVDESHSIKGRLEYPQYTRPEIFEAENKKYPVPDILLSGNHQRIKEWRDNQIEKK